MIHVFYDGKCGLCSREINYYKRLRADRPIAWHDIAADPAHLNGTGLSQADALMFLRVKDETGNIRTGVDAFILLWQQFAGWNVVARFAGLPGVHVLAGKLYAFFARHRFSRHPHCRASLAG